MIALGWNMRQKMITLDPTSWEYAAKKRNFSGWVRKKLMEEQAESSVITESLPMFGAYCDQCDSTYTNPQQFRMEEFYCKKCHTKCEYMGVVQ